MRIILFDGICNLCSGAVAFVIKKDKKALFRFAAMQSEAGQVLLRQHHLQGEAPAFYDVNSTFYVLHYIPLYVRDAVYLFVSRNRYQWFGKRKSCGVPMSGVKDWFIVSDERIDAQSSK